MQISGIEIKIFLTEMQMLLFEILKSLFFYPIISVKDIYISNTDICISVRDISV